MIGAMFNGLSGLDTFQKALNTQSNNIANVNTVGYKSDVVQFSDLMYQEGVGKGSSVATVTKNYEQGNLRITGNDYDVALEGNGFFHVSSLISPNEILYTRSGNFLSGKDGNLQTQDYRSVLGSSMNAMTANDIVATDPNFQQFSTQFDFYIASQVVQTDTLASSINAKATNIQSSATTDDASMSGLGYKTSGIKISDVNATVANYRSVLDEYSKNPISPGTASTQQVQEYVFDMTQLDDESDTLKIFIEDGYYQQQFQEDAATTLNLFADKISAIPGLSAVADTVTGTVTITNLVPGTQKNINSATLNNIESADQVAQLGTKGTGLAMVTSARDAVKLAVENAGGMFLEITNYVDKYFNDPNGAYTNPEINGEIQLKLDRLGISNDADGKFEIDENGLVTVNQDDSKFVVGQLAVSWFNDPYALKPNGSNTYAKTQLSGDPYINTGYVVFHGKTLEMSNSNLAENLTDLMVFQRAYEANAKSVTTSDQFLNIAIQLKK